VGTEVTPEQLADFQRTVDEINAEFIAAVAKGRGLSPAQAKAVNDGRIHIAGAALGLNLIDAIGDLDAAADEVRKLAGIKRTGSPARVSVMGARRENGANLKEKTMSDETTGAAPGSKPATLTELKKGFPDSTAEWRESMAELSASVSDAQGCWMDELRKKNKALAEKSAAQESRIAELEAAATAQSKAAAKAPSFEPVASGGTSSNVEGEQALLDEAVKASGGSARKGIEALQAKLLKPYTDKGLTHKAAREACLADYPLIFGRAA
jgi:ClpP class serine protease